MVTSKQRTPRSKHLLWRAARPGPEVPPAAGISGGQDAGTGLLAVAGVGMVVVGFFPCDAGGVDVTATGQRHSLFSMPGAIGLPAAAMVSALAFRHDGRFGTPGRRSRSGSGW